MTAYGTAKSAVDARRHGADAYLVKPFAMPDLLVALHRALETAEVAGACRELWSVSSRTLPARGCMDDYPMST